MIPPSIGRRTTGPSPPGGARVALYLQRCAGAPLAPGFGWLQGEELERASGFRNQLARNEFITGRRLARLVIARLLGRDPPDLRLRISQSGQPRLEPDAAAERCHFSIAHSHGLVLCAASLDLRVGADVEPNDRASALTELQRRYLSPGEREALQRLPPAGRERWMLERWVDKEAYSKVLGMGLQLPFADIRVLPRGNGRALFDNERDPAYSQEVQRWHPSVENGYLVSVVCEIDPCGDAALSVLDLGTAG